VIITYSIIRSQLTERNEILLYFPDIHETADSDLITDIVYEIPNPYKRAMGGDFNDKPKPWHPSLVIDISSVNVIILTIA
jgi:hypothetical protein